MQIWCGLTADQLGDKRPDLIVFPEGVGECEITKAGQLAPNAIVVGAIAEDGRMHGVIRHRGEDKISYWKVGNDLRSNGSPLPTETPVYICDEVAVGLLVCMDVDHPQLLKDVIEQLLQAPTRRRVLCIAGDMAPEWFPTDPVGYPSWGDLHVALSNNDKTYGVYRRRNFITDHRRRIAVAQVDSEAIALELDTDFS